MGEIGKTGVKTKDGYFLNTMHQTEALWEIVPKDDSGNGMVKVQERIVKQLQDITDLEERATRLEKTYYIKETANGAAFRHNKLNFRPKAAEVSPDVKAALEARTQRVMFSEEQVLEFAKKIIGVTDPQLLEKINKEGITLKQLFEALQIEN